MVRSDQRYITTEFSVLRRLKHRVDSPVVISQFGRTSSRRPRGDHLSSSKGKRLRGKARTAGLAERLKRARRDAGLTQERVAEALHVHTKAVYTWESGRNEPTIDHLNELATLYRKPVDWLVDGTGDELTEHRDRIRDRIDRVPPNMLDVLERFLDSLDASRDR